MFIFLWTSWGPAPRAREGLLRVVTKIKTWTEIFYICSFCLKPFSNKTCKTSVPVPLLRAGRLNFEKVSSNSLD